MVFKGSLAIVYRSGQCGLARKRRAKNQLKICGTRQWIPNVGGEQKHAAMRSTNHSTIMNETCNKSLHRVTHAVTHKDYVPIACSSRRG